MQTKYFSLLRTASFFILLFILTNGCKKKEDTTKVQGPNDIWLQDSKFIPAEKTVTKGTTITWTNQDPYNHTVTSNTGLFDSGNFGKNETFAYKFDSVGVFNYSCGIHLTMTGKVTVIP